MKTIGYIILILFVLWGVGGLIRKKKHRHRVIHVVEENCTGCKSCLKKCNHHVLEAVNDEKGQHVVVKYPNRCTGCGDCLRACKFNALTFVLRVK